MPGLGTIINVVAIVAGGLLGTVGGRLFDERMQDGLEKACGICVMFIGLAGALSGMLSISEGELVSGLSLFVVISVVVGTFFGEIINIDGAIRRFGEWIKRKTGNEGDRSFVNAFVIASITICVGAMAVVGSVEDGLTGDCSILVTKAILDFVIILAMTCSLGKGCAFSAIPVGLFQGSITALAVFIKPLITDQALASLSMVGGILIFCVGVNLVWGRKVRVANMLPAILVAPMLTVLPIDW